MYRLRYSRKGRSFRKKNDRTFAFSTAILFAAFCAASVLLVTQAKSHTALKGTGAYFNATESATIQFKITFDRQGEDAQQGIAGTVAGQSADSAAGSASGSEASSSQGTSEAGTTGRQTESQAESSQTAGSQVTGSQDESVPSAAEVKNNAGGSSSAGTDSAQSGMETQKAAESGR